MSSKKKTSSKDGIVAFFNRHPILKHLILAALFLLLILLLTLLWLRIYTNHGQKLSVPDLIGENYTEARKLAKKQSFNLVVTDSVYLIGKDGGLIHKQNPVAESKVKENRKIYVTVTKFTPDKIKVKDLPTLYGNDFSQKNRELEYRGIKSTIKDRKYDPGEPNHILEVYYNGKLIIDKDVFESEIEIDKGGTLEFTVSDKGGGEITVPSLICKTLSEVEFLLDNSKLKVGEINVKGIVENRDSAFILAQNPPHDGISKIAMGSSIDITLVKEKPDQCN